MRYHHDYSKVQEAIAAESTFACAMHLNGRLAHDLEFEVADDRFRTSFEEAIRETLESFPGADPGLVRAHFAFRPLGDDQLSPPT